jgi:hypothetical protein
VKKLTTKSDRHLVGYLHIFQWRCSSRASSFTLKCMSTKAVILLLLAFCIRKYFRGVDTSLRSAKTQKIKQLLYMIHTLAKDEYSDGHFEFWLLHLLCTCNRFHEDLTRKVVRVMLVFPHFYYFCPHYLQVVVEN